MVNLKTHLNKKGFKYSDIPEPIAREIEVYICLLKEEKDQQYAELYEAVEKGEVTYLWLTIVLKKLNKKNLT